MDQYDELIEMQEGSHDGDNQVTDILDVDDSRVSIILYNLYNNITI